VAVGVRLAAVAPAVGPGVAVAVADAGEGIEEVLSDVVVLEHRFAEFGDVVLVVLVQDAVADVVEVVAERTGEGTVEA